MTKNIYYSLLVLSYGLFTYYLFGEWWNSSVGTLLILLFSYLIWGNGFLKQIGLKVGVKTIIKALILVGLVLACSVLVMKNIANKQDIQITFSHWRNYYHNIFYIINEEIVIGSISLFALVNNYKIKPVIASIGLAVAFALIHFISYKWFFEDRGLIGISTLISLFLIGFVRNTLILQTGHIAYSWALHFGWMAVMFGSMHIDMQTNLQVTERARFNLYLGSNMLVIISIILAALIILLQVKRYWTNEKNQLKI